MKSPKIVSNASSWLRRSALTAAVIIILVTTLLPAEPAGDIDWHQVFCVLCGRAALADAFANVGLFLPLGAALVWAGFRPGRALILAAGLSLSVELAQFAIPGRDPSLGDFFFNAVGAVLGGSVVRLTPRWAVPGVRAASRLSLLAAIVVAAVFILTDALLTVSLPNTTYFGGSASVQSSVKPLRLGGNIEPYGYFQGRLDDVRIYHRARTAAEIQADMRTPVTAAHASPDLVASYNFDEGTGTVLTDVSGHGNTGQIRGAAWTSEGRSGGALEFDGEASVVVIPHSPTLDLTAAMTLEAWVYPTAAQRGWRAIVQKEFDTYFLLAGSRMGPLRPAGGGTFGASTEVLATPFVVPTHTWTHVALTYDGAVLQLYADGRSVMRRLRWYPSRVTSATLDGLTLPSGLAVESRQLRDGLLAGAPLRIRILAAPPPLTMAPLVTLHDAVRNEILLVAVEGEDVVVRLRTRATAAELDNPMLRAQSVLHGLQAGDPLTLTIWRPGRRYCVEVNARSTCDLGFSLGKGWAVFAYSQIPPGWPHAVLNAMWMAALLFPFGYWLRRRWESLLAAMVVTVGSVLPCVLGHLSIAPVEIAGAVGGTLAGWACARTVQYLWSVAPDC